MRDIKDQVRELLDLADRDEQRGIEIEELHEILSRRPALPDGMQYEHEGMTLAEALASANAKYQAVTGRPLTSTGYALSNAISDLASKFADYYDWWRSTNQKLELETARYETMRKSRDSIEAARVAALERINAQQGALDDQQRRLDALQQSVHDNVNQIIERDKRIIEWQALYEKVRTRERRLIKDLRAARRPRK